MTTKPKSQRPKSLSLSFRVANQELLPMLSLNWPLGRSDTNYQLFTTLRECSTGSEITLPGKIGEIGQILHFKLER